MLDVDVYHSDRDIIHPHLILLPLLELKDHIAHMKPERV
jgi:hypothetical protein